MDGSGFGAFQDLADDVNAFLNARFEGDEHDIMFIPNLLKVE